MKILIVEDEAEIAKPLKAALEKKNYIVEWIDDGKEAYKLASIEVYDCIILDLNLPSMDGIDIATKLRENEITTPILMLTARSEKEQIWDGFESGTDDYLTKPFDFKELILRIAALIKRSSFNKSDILEIDKLKLDTNSGQVTLGDEIINLNRKEFGILEYLLRNKGKIVSQEELLEHVWDREIDIFTDTVRTNIKTLRKKVDANKKIIKTIKGRGYTI